MCAGNVVKVQEGLVQELSELETMHQDDRLTPAELLRWL